KSMALFRSMLRPPAVACCLIALFPTNNNNNNNPQRFQPTTCLFLVTPSTLDPHLTTQTPISSFAQALHPS
ncbi:hypothetical protein EDB84DRAFT_1450324, partial [Lactarius hengduanensis]